MKAILAPLFGAGALGTLLQVGGSVLDPQHVTIPVNFGWQIATVVASFASAWAIMRAKVATLERTVAALSESHEVGRRAAHQELEEWTAGLRRDIAQLREDTPRLRDHEEAHRELDAAFVRIDQSRGILDQVRVDVGRLEERARVESEYRRELSAVRQELGRIEGMASRAS